MTRTDLLPEIPADRWVENRTYANISLHFLESSRYEMGAPRRPTGELARDLEKEKRLIGIYRKLDV